MKPSRRLVLFLDGTWNEDAAHAQDTNVVRLRDLISETVTSNPYVSRNIDEIDDGAVEIAACPYRDCDYFIFYERGVGTGPGLSRISEGAFGYGVDRNIRRAYRFLSRHYISGSEIFIFGFSRGAYTARSVVGLVGTSGLLRAEHCTVELEKQAWENYATAPNARYPGVKNELDKHVHSISDVRFACVGAFDTVAALGPLSSFWRTNRERYEFHDVLLSPIVKLHLHALAIDERRLQFEASIWRQGKYRASNSVTEQTWFPGDHSDVGGGVFSKEDRYHSPERMLDDVTLDWMLKRVLYHYPDFPIQWYQFNPIWGGTDRSTNSARFTNLAI